ncbi:uncharacterized protein LOC143568201 [Bidens hawaiensis]|uniref:uncharacterized protein LOC143568201 n=1 Tax=Bidens hawaiensis TaxID=980011 RepID=UPI00404A2886
MVERGEAQIPIYFDSHTLKGPEERYLPVENLVLALNYTARKLQRYFQAHVVQVLTDQPLQQVLSKPEMSGRLTKWAIELGDHTLKYKPRNAVKRQVLANFLTETEGETEGEKGKTSSSKMDERKEEKRGEVLLKLYTDEASNEEGSGAGLILVSPEGIELTYAIWLGFPSTNNEAEYEALLAGLRIAEGVKAKRIRAHVDSLMVFNQVGGSYDARDPKKREYLKVTQELLKKLKHAEIMHIPSSSNKKIDAMSKLAAVAFDHLANEVKVETLQQPSVTEVMVAHVETQESNWMNPFIRYFKEGKIPEDKEEERKLRIKALQYEIIEGSYTGSPT